MQNSFKKSSQISLRELTPEDWPAYKDYYKSLSNPQHFSGYFKNKNLDAPDTGKNFFDDMQRNRGETFKLFGLFDKDKIIGQTSIRFTKNENGSIAILGGSEITDSYRGLRLVDKLYEFRMNYLRQKGFEGDIRMTIAPNNTPSQKAAARNGFVKTGEQNSEGFDILKPESFIPPTSP